MNTLFLLSIVLAGVALPMRAASDPDPRRGLLRASAAMLVCSIGYVVGLLYVLPRILR
jgi:hypothetical protein